MIIRIGRTELRVIAALFVTAMVPLIAAMAIAVLVIQRISQTAFNPEFDLQLERSFEVYADLVSHMKSSMRHAGAAIAERAPLRAAAAERDRTALEGELARALADHPELVSAVVTVDDEPFAHKGRARPLDEARERPFTVTRPLGDDGAPSLELTFAADKTRLDQMESANEFARAHRELASENRDAWVDATYLRIVAALFGFTVLLSVITGILVVRPATRRINRLAAATRPVAEGDLSVRVDAEGKDEIAALARAFNRMLETLDKSRARIEFLKRVGEWQHMARRLAHEIKNPLTPIQLAVEECRRRYRGDDGEFATLLGTTHDIVVEEVQGLRRLVGEFAEFARLPQADLERADLGECLRELWPRIEQGEVPIEGVTLELDVDDEPMPVALDRTLLYRVLVNLVSNAAQAIAGGVGQGTVRVSARRAGESCVVAVDDDGPGVSRELRAKVFDPYVTTKRDGTGLGLTIVKKVVIDHGGHIDVDDSPLGGARFQLRLPVMGSSASDAALTRSEIAPLSGRA